jgi:carbonic anhydrase
MKKLIQGLREFKNSYVSTHRELFEQLSHGQKPRVLFVTCSDSRIDPVMLTHTELGDLFVIRNAGNIIPPYGAANGGEGASVEYAIHALGISQIVVCGHSHCGAMKGLLQLGNLEEEMPLVYDWLRHAEATRRLVKENYSDRTKDEMLEIAIAENVITQIENLKTYPVVRSRLFQGKLMIFGWVYLIETGEVLAYDPETHSYVPPQSQLPDYIPGDVPQPGAFKSTSAPPVACEVPGSTDTAVAYPNPMPVAASASTPSIAAPSLPDSDPPAAPVAPAASGNGNGNSHTPWLTPEQADRIYRGSARR